VAYTLHETARSEIEIDAIIQTECTSVTCPLFYWKVKEEARPISLIRMEWKIKQVSFRE